MSSQSLAVDTTSIVAYIAKCTNKDLCHQVAGPCKLYILQNVIIKAVLGCAVGHMIRKVCIVHGREVYTGVQRSL